MKNMDTVLTIIERTSRQVDAIETLAASLAAGMHAGVVDPDQLYTLLTSHMASIQANLVALASGVKEVVE
jgi:hypothetical protein